MSGCSRLAGVGAIISFLLFGVCGVGRADVHYNKSWIYVDASNGGRPLTSGDTWEVPVDYYLDPSEHADATTLTIWGTGPWIDTPDGKYTTKRGHIGYPGLSGRATITEPGKGRHVFTFTVPKGLELVKKNNRLLLLGSFRSSEGVSWPWHVRAGNSFVRRRGFFEIETETPGHLFTYDEPVRIFARLKNVERPGQKKTLHYTVHDTTGAVAAEGRREFTVERDGQRVDIDLDLKRRGVFLIELDVPGWEKRHTTFARIPDLNAITGGRPTRFGMTTHWDAPPEEVWAIARRLGLTSCRRFTRWYRLQPGVDVYKIDALEKELDTAKRHGVDVWLCVVDPPPAAFPGRVEPISYRAFNFREDVWRDFVGTVTTRLRGKFYGWEWLNEITPGGCDDPVGTYVSMCRIGTETAKAIDPDLVTILAGGLYPRSFRGAMLAAGVGRYVDVLPVHYQNGDGVFEARQDLDAAGEPDVAVWEDESAKGLNAWGVPPLEELQNTTQSDWVLRQWTDELAAGCEKIIYFGGSGSNMTQYLADGKAIRLYDTQVFRCGDNNPHWQVFTCRKRMPAGAERVSFTPVVKGSGWAMIDNVRVTLYEGTDYAAEAHRVDAPPKIDGNLDEWVSRCPVPLIGSNQIIDRADDYAWTPDNLSAVGYLAWDEANLYVAFRVRDDLHHPTGSGKSDGSELLRGDGLILGVDPTHRGPRALSEAFAYYVSSAEPSGGSGQHTLFRPEAHSGGRPSGHLFKDSSIYDMAVTHGEGICVYELRIPWTELGIDGGLGTKIGLSIRLNDNDGAGPVAQMTWGGGLPTEWSPNRFGVVTFVE